MSNLTAEHPKGLSAFFKESDTSLGLFYPRHYILATFSSFEAAKQAYLELRKAGFDDDEVIPVSGSDALDFFEEFRDHAGIWGHLMIEFSRFIDTEAMFLDKDIRRARRGAGFLAVHCKSERQAQRIREISAPLAPLAMDWYLPAAIQSLV